MSPRQFAEACNADIRRMTSEPERTPLQIAADHYLRQLERDAEAYRFLRDPPDDGRGDPEAAVLWEELLTKGCRGAIWDKTVAALRELYAAKGWT